MLVSQSFVTIVTLFCAAVSANTPPSYEGFTGKWSDHFNRAADVGADTNKWNTISTSAVFNNEWQTYTNKPANVRVRSLFFLGTLLRPAKRSTTRSRGE
jgi:hypothetical protein